MVGRRVSGASKKNTFNRRNNSFKRKKIRGGLFGKCAETWNNHLTKYDRDITYRSTTNVINMTSIGRDSTSDSKYDIKFYDHRLQKYVRIKSIRFSTMKKILQELRVNDISMSSDINLTSFKRANKEDCKQRFSEINQFCDFIQEFTKGPESRRMLYQILERNIPDRTAYTMDGGVLTSISFEQIIEREAQFEALEKRRLEAQKEKTRNFERLKAQAEALEKQRLEKITEAQKRKARRLEAQAEVQEREAQAEVQEREARELMDQGQNAIESGNYNEAQELFYRAMQMNISPNLRAEIEEKNTYAEEKEFERVGEQISPRSVRSPSLSLPERDFSEIEDTKAEAHNSPSPPTRSQAEAEIKKENPDVYGNISEKDVRYSIFDKAVKQRLATLRAKHNRDEKRKRSKTNRQQQQVTSQSVTSSQEGENTIGKLSKSRIQNIEQGIRGLPQGWNTATDPYGRTYYYNTDGQTQWNKPIGGGGSRRTNKSRTNKKIRRKNTKKRSSRRKNTKKRNTKRKY